jgi:hypothetical protein
MPPSSDVRLREPVLAAVCGHLFRVALASALASCSSAGSGTHPHPGTGGAEATGGASASGGSAGQGTGGVAGPVDAANGGTGPAADASSPVDASAGPDDGAAPAGACAQLFGKGVTSEWVHYDEQGRLVYKPLDARGDRIMDFSYAGYRGGGVALPDVPVVMTIGPSGGDDSAAIQAAIDQVSAKPLVNGVRGALLLEAGAYRSSRPLTIAASGVVLRGSGAGPDGTVIDLTDASHIFLLITGASGAQGSGPKASITDDYVPSGTRSFSVDDASAFKVGDAVLIDRPVTAAWISYLGMDKLIRDGVVQTWMTPGNLTTWERTITAIEGNKVTLDVPLSDSFDAAYVKPPGGTMQKYAAPGRISQVGLENFRVTAPLRTAAQASDPGHGGSQFVEATNLEDSWIKGLVGHNTVEGIHLEGGCTRITIEDTVIEHDPTDYFTSSAPFDFNINAQRVLIQRSASKGGNKIFFVATHHAAGPNAVLDFQGTGTDSHIQPHLRWATGLLVDRTVTDSPGTGASSAIGFMNRGTAGGGHGWSVAWAVCWNCTAQTILNQQPPGAMNWVIGGMSTPSPPTNAPGVPGAPMPNGIFESNTAAVAPSSLYLAQLCDRLGPAALARIGQR